MPKSYQTKKVRRDKFTFAFFCITLMLFLVFWTLYTYRQLSVCRNIATGNLCTFSGNFSYEERHPPRNTTYYFHLNNGDTVVVLPELVDNDDAISTSSELAFRYSPPKHGRYSSYTAVEIVSVDGTICFLSMDDSLHGARLGVWCGGVFGILTIALLVAILLCRNRMRLRKKRQ